MKVDNHLLLYVTSFYLTDCRMSYFGLYLLSTDCWCLLKETSSLSECLLIVAVLYSLLVLVVHFHGCCFSMPSVLEHL